MKKIKEIIREIFIWEPNVIKNLEEHSGYYSAIIHYETEFRGRDKKPSFKAWLKEFTEEYQMGTL